MEENNLYNLLTKGKHDEIKTKLFDELSNIGTYCTKILGKGYFGTVVESPIGKTAPILIDKKIIDIDVVTKLLNHSDGFVRFHEVDKTLIIYGSNTITCETIILFMISRLWYQGLNLHLPFMVGFNMCESNVVKSIILEKYGFSELMLLSIEEYFILPYKYINKTIKSDSVYFSTVSQLINYILINVNTDLTCKLFNDEIISFPELIDKFCIFYLHTSAFLWNTLGIVLNDQHLDNIFIQWLKPEHICGKKNIGNIKYIYYQIDKDKFIKIDVNTFIFKIGDVGCNFMVLPNDTIIVGDIVIPDKINEIVMYKNKVYTYMDALYNLFINIPVYILNKTQIFQYLLVNKELSKFIPFLGYKKEYHDILPSELQLLESVYSDKITKKPESNNDNFIVSLK
jgi:hypothetical protein